MQKQRDSEGTRVSARLRKLEPEYSGVVDDEEVEEERAFKEGATLTTLSLPGLQQLYDKPLAHYAEDAFHRNDDEHQRWS